jgi:predicted esterase
MVAKLRVLCLHGYHGSGRILQEQMAPLRRNLEHLAEFVYVDAPSRADGDFGWWHAVGDPVRYKGWPRTRDWIREFVSTNGPFDGVFGFSQGAALTGLLVGTGIPLRFAVMAGGFLADDPELFKTYDAKEAYELPSAHVIGKVDSIVAPAYSYELSARFARPLVLEHDGGHVIPNAHSVVHGVESLLVSI